MVRHTYPSSVNADQSSFAPSRQVLGGQLFRRPWPPREPANTRVLPISRPFTPCGAPCLLPHLWAESTSSPPPPGCGRAAGGGGEGSRVVLLLSGVHSRPRMLPPFSPPPLGRGCGLTPLPKPSKLGLHSSSCQMGPPAKSQPQTCRTWSTPHI